MPTAAFRLRGDRVSPVFSVPPDYVSVTLDTSQFIGGYWWEGSQRMRRGVGGRRVAPFDFERPGLRTYAGALSPALLRVGGSEADKLYYDLRADPVAEPPDGFEYVLRRSRWEALVSFADAVGMRLVFTVNAGPGPRDRRGLWTAENARHLMTAVREERHPVLGWELGNEINAFVVIHGLRGRVSSRRYARDFRLFRDTVRKTVPGTLAAGPASAFWPVLGEFQRVTEPFLKRVDGDLDVLTWHYYPQQSERGPFATRRAGLRTMLEPAFLDDAARIQRRLAGYRDRHTGSTVPIWLGETGNAQFGGQEGVSDRFAGTLWWVDELGLMARHGVQRIFRQTLAGADYGLLDYRSGAANPDYWATLLWKRLCGGEVYDAVEPQDSRLRLYCHSRADGAAGLVFVCINLAERDTATAEIPSDQWEPEAFYLLTAESLESRTVFVNAEQPALECFASPQTLRATGHPLTTRTLQLPPLSVAWVVVRE
jgi:heparanase 1